MVGDLTFIDSSDRPRLDNVDFAVFFGPFYVLGMIIMVFQGLAYLGQEDDIFIGYFLFGLFFFGQVYFYVLVFAVGPELLD